MTFFVLWSVAAIKDWSETPLPVLSMNPSPVMTRVIILDTEVKKRPLRCGAMVCIKIPCISFQMAVVDLIPWLSPKSSLSISELHWCWDTLSPVLSWDLQSLHNFPIIVASDATHPMLRRVFSTMPLVTR
jgi:hypothetical protein